MSTLLQTPETAGERPLWLADDTVLIGPVSGPKFPDNREFNREFFKFGPFSTNLASNRPAISIACSKIPYAMEQGIIFAEQGILAPEQGIPPRINFDQYFDSLIGTRRQSRSTIE
jgi:hypothetical protein